MTRKQDLFKQRPITQDDFPWKTPPYEEVGGLDISFCTEDPSVGFATLVVLDFCTLYVVLEESAVVRLDVLGFLAFREAPKPTQDASKSIFVSVGHRIFLDTAVRIVWSTSKYKNPEPVRKGVPPEERFLC